MTLNFSAVIYLWDLETGASSSSVDVAAGRSPLDGHKDSIYSLAVNQSGSRLVSGSTENVRFGKPLLLDAALTFAVQVIRVWDPRDGKKTMKLKGHTDSTL